MNNLKAVALCNNASAMIVWVWDGVIPDCLGFSLRRIDKKTGVKKVIDSRLVKFKGETTATGTTTDEHPIQGCKWIDGQAKEGGTYQWEVVPMLGKAGALKPGEAVLTNEVTLGLDYGPYIQACFNRGHLVSTQALADMLPKTAEGTPDPQALMKAINDPDSQIFKWLSAGIGDFIRLPYEEAKKIGGHVFSLYYELSSPIFVKYLRENESLWSMVLGNTGKTDETNAATRKQLHADGADVTDRFIPEGGIAHNKSAVLVDKDQKPTKWLLQSANPTPTGLCTQANQALYITSPALAQAGKDYYERTKADCAADPIQSSEYRAANAKIMDPVALGDGTTVQAIFSPSTQVREKPRTGPDGKSFALLDMAASTKTIKDYLLKMKQGAYFVAFYPGSPSFLDVLSWLKYKHPELPIRGTVSTPLALPRAPRKPGSGAGKTGGGKTGTDKTDAGQTTATAAPAADQIITATAAQVVGMAKTASGLLVPGHLVSASDGTATADNQSLVVPATVIYQPRKRTPTIIAASALENGWKEWHKELLKLPDAHAITHSKIIVIDPFGDDPIILGAASDNLGLKASVNNDETMLVIKGNRALAIAVFVFCSDVYRHFLWRYLVSTGQSTFSGELSDTTDWQKKYLSGKTNKEYAAMVNGSGLLKTA